MEIRADRINRTLTTVTLAALIVFQVTAAALLPQIIDPDRFYKLASGAEAIIGENNEELAKKLSFDAQKDLYQYNKEAAPIDQGNSDNPEAVAAQLAAQQQASGNSEKIGGGADNYSVNLNVDPEKGVTIHDATDKSGSLAVTLIPQFDLRSAKQKDGRIIYPLKGMSGHLVYSVKSNGLKEDIVLNEFAGDKLSFSYKLNLPSSLEARLLPNGGVGIYSADSTLFGNISYGSDTDRERVEKARANAEKNHLVFAIPAPQVVQSGQGSDQIKSEFFLENDILTVKTAGLEKASYPLSIDPSVVVTSATDFQKGNLEGGIDIDTSGHLKRAGLTGGSVGSWAVDSDSNLPGTETTTKKGVVYNGYIYRVGGSLAADPVLYNQINSDGTLGSWNPTTAYGVDTKHPAVAAYNGYIYMLGGTNNSGNTDYNTVYYSKINTSDGTLGSWNSAGDGSTFTTARFSFGAEAYNGYLYLFGGCTNLDGLLRCNAYSNDVQYAPIKGDGTLGAWNSAGDGSTFTTARTGFASAAYNGYLYIIGGCSAPDIGAGSCSGAGTLSDVQYAAIKADGSLGAWVTNSIGIGNARYNFSGDVYNGYLYISVGSGSGFRYAPINADGSVGAWSIGSTLNTARFSDIMVAYKGFVYDIGGQNGSNPQNSVEYAPVNSVGPTGLYSTNANNYDSAGREGAGVVAYNSCLYVIGGNNGPSLNTIRYAVINADGSTGTWSTNANNYDNGGGTARQHMGAVAYNGYLYLVGGQHTGNTYSAEVNYAAFNSSGCGTGTFTKSANAIGTARSGLALVGYNGFLFAIGGVNNNNSTPLATVEYSQIGTGGAPGAWTTTTSMGAARRGTTAVVTNGYIYATGGGDNIVEYALICTGQNNGTGGCGATPGTVGTWSTTSTYTNSRWWGTLSVNNGYMYLTGGSSTQSSFGSTLYNDTQYARINTDGTLSSWTSTNSFTTPRSHHRSIIHNGVLYVVGGCSLLSALGPGCNSAGQTLADLQYAPVNNGGSGFNSAWTQEDNLSAGSTNGCSVALNGYLYVIAGDGISTHTAVQVAAINSDRTLGSFSTTTTLTVSQSFPACTTLNGYIYVMGSNVGGAQNYVSFAKPNADGTIPAAGAGTWTTTSGFSGARARASAVSYNGYIYLMGGCTASCNALPVATLSNTVQYARPNSDGTIPAAGAGSWTIDTGFTTAREDFGAAVYNGYLYVAGGCVVAGNSGGCDTYDNSVQFAKIGSSGALESDAGCSSKWCIDENFGTPRRYINLSAQNGYMYIVGGYNGTNLVDTQIAPIGPSGKLGLWQRSGNNITAHGQGATQSIYKGVLYIAGGNATSTRTDIARLQSIPRQGQFSWLVDMEGDALMTKLLWRGTESNPLGMNFGYRSAPHIGATFGSLASESLMASNSLYTLTASENRYRWLRFTLDDSSSAIFPDSLGSPSTIEDFELWYHPATADNGSKRLRNGGTFTTETKKSLDAQPQQ